MRVGRDFGERERACRFWACFSRRGLVWACFSPATDDANCEATEDAPHGVSRCIWRARMWRAFGVHVGERSDHVHSAGACRAGQACRACRACRAYGTEQVWLVAQVRLVQRLGLCKG